MIARITPPARALVGILALAILCWSAGCSKKEPAREEAPKSPPQAVTSLAGEGAAKLPAFSLADQDGKTVSLSDYKDSIVVLEWASPECPVAQRYYQAGITANLARKYQPKGVVWLAINSGYDSTPQINKVFSAKYGLPYPVLDDHAGQVGRGYGAIGTPQVMILGKTGTRLYSGGVDNNANGKLTAGITNFVEKALDEILAGKEVTLPQTKPYGCAIQYAPSHGAASSLTQPAGAN